MKNEQVSQVNGYKHQQWQHGSVELDAHRSNETLRWVFFWGAM
jgi:hypothetical protein